MAAIAFICYWWVGRPTIYAERFSAAMARGDVAAADALCLDPNRRFVNRAAHYFRPRGSVNPNNKGENNLPPIEFVAGIAPRTWDDLWRGQRRITLQIAEASSSQIGGSDTRITTLGEIIRPSALATHVFTATSMGVIPPPDPTPAWAAADTRLNPGPSN
jgi:hypothetical protein